jgi:hypothetical protein
MKEPGSREYVRACFSRQAQFAVAVPARLRVSEPLPKMTLVKTTLIAAALFVALALVASAQQPRPTGQPGAATGQTDKLQSEVIISTLPTSDLTKQITAATGAIEHRSEIARGGPVAAVVRTTGCMKDTAGTCKVSADIVIYKPDGLVFHEVKSLDLPAGRGAVPLKIDANTATGVYKVVVTVRDLTARRFATVERQFGVK